jgi:hypothetical protein
LLNDNFTGGGTRFWDRSQQAPFGHVQPTRPGQLLAHNALVNHEGFPIESGTRIILVGFLSVDRVNPFDRAQSSGMSWYTTWMSLPWMHVKFKEGYLLSMSRLDRNEGNQTKWADNMYMRSLFRDMANFLEQMGDLFSPHRIENLVDESKADEYLAALDDAYLKESQSFLSYETSKWFQGATKNDIDGTIDSGGTPRNSDRFSEL